MIIARHYPRIVHDRSGRWWTDCGSVQEGRVHRMLGGTNKVNWFVGEMVVDVVA